MAHFNVSQDAWLRWFDTSARVTSTLVLRNHLKTSLEPHDARVEHRLERHVLPRVVDGGVMATGVLSRERGDLITILITRY